MLVRELLSRFDVSIFLNKELSDLNFESVDIDFFKSYDLDDDIIVFNGFKINSNGVRTEYNLRINFGLMSEEVIHEYYDFMTHNIGSISDDLVELLLEPVIIFSYSQDDRLNQVCFNILGGLVKI